MNRLTVAWAVLRGKPAMHRVAVTIEKREEDDPVFYSGPGIHLLSISFAYDTQAAKVRIEELPENPPGTITNV